MYSISGNFTDNVLYIKISGHLDTNAAPAAEKEIKAILGQNDAGQVVLDCEKLEYISSSGLRVVLRLKKSVPDLELVNVSPDVYDIFEMTGFTEMMTVKKAYRTLSVEGCEVIGKGANGEVYRIGPDTIVKVYLNPDSLPEIHRERELARTAFVLGVPTAIPYDVVRIEGGGYGSVFELLNAKSYAALLASGEKTVDEVAKLSTDLLKIIHSTVVQPDSMPDMKAVALDWARFLRDYLDPVDYEKLYSLVNAIPNDNHMMHGDYHIRNVMVQEGESLLIDMDTLCHGHPVFELGSMFNAYVGYGQLDHSITKEFLKIPYETAGELWRKILFLYLDTDDESIVNDVEKKAKIIGYMRLMRRSIRRGGLETEEGRRDIENSHAHLKKLLSEVDTLIF